MFIVYTGDCFFLSMSNSGFLLDSIIDLCGFYSPLGICSWNETSPTAQDPAEYLSFLLLTHAVWGFPAVRPWLWNMALVFACHRCLPPRHSPVVVHQSSLCDTRFAPSSCTTLPRLIFSGPPLGCVPNLAWGLSTPTVFMR